MPSLGCRGHHEAARVHTFTRQCRSHVAANCACAAGRERSQNRRTMAWSNASGCTAYGILRLALRQFGYIEGQTVAIELRYAEKGVRQLPELAAELVSRKVDVITAFGDLAPQVAQQATGKIPIVAICDDIVGAG